jgi:iron complex outermembrane receptor protein
MYNDAAARSHNMSNSGIYSSSGNGFLSNKPASALVTNFNKNAPDSHMSDYYVQDASFARIDNITAGYSFDKVLDVFSGGRIYASLQNPLIITNYSGLDPEIFDGIDRDLYPRPVVTMIGLSLKF